MRYLLTIALATTGCVTINECPRQEQAAPVLDLQSDYEIGQKIPAGDGCNTCTYLGNGMASCTLLSCGGTIQLGQ